MSVAQIWLFIYPSLPSSLVPMVSCSTLYPATPTSTNQSDRSDSIFLPSSIKRAKKGKSLPVLHVAMDTTQTFPCGIMKDLLRVSFMEGWM